MNFKILLALCVVLALSTVGSAIGVSHSFPTAKKHFKGDDDASADEGRRLADKTLKKK